MRLKTAVFATFARQVFVMGLNFTSISLVSRTLGVVEFGRYSFMLAALAVFQAVFSLSVPVVIVHFYAPMQQTGRLGQLLGNGLIISIWAVLGGSIVAAFAIYFSGHHSIIIDPLAVIVLYILFMLQMAISYFEAIIIGVRDYRMYNILLLGSPVLQVLLLVVLREFYTQSNEVLCVTLATTLTMAPFYWFAARSRGLRSLSNGDTMFTTYLGYGVQMWISNVITMATYRMPFFLIESTIGSVGLGQYALAAQFSEKLWVPGRSVAAILFPERSSGQATGKSAAIFQQTLRVISGNMSIVFLGAVILYLLFSKYITEFFGPGYQDVPNLVLALALGMVAWSGVTILGAELAGSGDSGANCFASLAALIIGTISIIIMISTWGLVGAAIGTSVGYIGGFCVSFLLFYKNRR